jgi:hypothetical protein
MIRIRGIQIKTNDYVDDFALQFPDACVKIKNTPGHLFHNSIAWRVPLLLYLPGAPYGR